MKSILKLLLITLLTTITISSINAQNTEKREKIKQILVKSQDSKYTLALYGIKDSTTFRVLGSVGKWSVNVKCFMRNAEKQDWYKDMYYKYYYAGRDGLYNWQIRFHDDDTIELLQLKLGSVEPTNVFIGEYE